MRPVIQSEKHYNNYSLTTVASTAVSRKDLVKGVALQDVSSAVDVPTGSIVKAVYLEIWIVAASTDVATFTLLIEKTSGAPTDITYTQTQNLNTYPNKKNVLYVTQGLFPGNTANPVPVVRQWFKVPKGKQRIGLGDEISVTIAATAQSLEYCGLLVFKHYT